MNRIPEIEVALRDTKIVSICLEYEFYSKSVKRNNSAVILFERFKKELLELKLIDLVLINMYEDFGSLYVSHIKAIDFGTNIAICLDPYNERINEIEERDNLVFSACKFELTHRVM
jgi:hypothetical protein